MTETRNPEELTPHPKNDEIYGDDVDESYIDRVETHGIQSKVKITPESQFTEVNWTIIGGHRRVEAANELGRTVAVEVVGPYDTQAEEVEALLADNDHRDKTPAQEIREVDQWAEVYRESPKLETDSAIEAACEHVSFSKATYWKGKKIQQASKEGEWGLQNPQPLSSKAIDEASEQWELLELGNTTIGGAFDTVKEAKEEAGAARTIPESRGGGGSKGLVREKVDIKEPVRAAFPTTPYRFRQLLKRVKPVRGNASEDEADLRLEIREDEVRVYTVASKYSFSDIWFGGVEITIENAPVHILLKHDDLTTGVGILEGETRVEFRGPKDSDEATHLVMTDGDAVLYLTAISDAVELPGTTIVRHESLDDSPL